jgi:hypothetical protein
MSRTALSKSARDEASFPALAPDVVLDDGGVATACCVADRRVGQWAPGTANRVADTPSLRTRVPGIHPPARVENSDSAK